jgi:putative ABC transport system substrate-binding protein
MNAGILPTKRLELLHEIVPAARTIAMLVNPSNANTGPDVAVIQQAARTLGLKIEPLLHATSERDLDATFATLAQTRAGGVLISPDAAFTGGRKKLATLTLQYRMPSIYNSREYVQVGGSPDTVVAGPKPITKWASIPAAC